MLIISMLFKGRRKGTWGCTMSRKTTCNADPKSLWDLLRNFWNTTSSETKNPDVWIGKCVSEELLHFTQQLYCSSAAAGDKVNERGSGECEDDSIASSQSSHSCDTSSLRRWHAIALDCWSSVGFKSLLVSSACERWYLDPTTLRIGFVEEATGREAAVALRGQRAFCSSYV